jgi:hypothetical protein
MENPKYLNRLFQCLRTKYFARSVYVAIVWFLK